MSEFDQSIVRTQESVLATNKVLKNTYILLSVTLLFSALMAFVASTIIPPQYMAVTNISSVIAAFLVLFFVLPRFKDSPGLGGIITTFLFTGLLGFGIGPFLGAIMQFHGNGGQIIATALGGTGVIFLALSAYVLKTKKDFSFMAGFLMAGIVIIILAAIMNIFLNIQGLSLAINVVVLLIFSGFILYDTSRIINGGEDNYINATVGLYLNIYNIFMALVHLLLAFSGDD